jgi:hypothetical protein
MKTWQKALIPTLITLAIGGIYLFSVWKQRQDPGVIGRTEATSTSTVDKDDLADVRQFFPHSFEDTLRLAGTTVWMKDGYAIPYFPYKGGRVEFGRRLGVIPSAQALNVKKVIKATVPDSVDDGMGHGDRQAIAVFTLPEGKDLYAMPIGILLVGEEQYYPDILFYYDDPHTIYSYWPKDVWAAIDAHQVKAGMSELQTQMAIGHMMHSHGGEEGNRTVTYDQGGKTWTVTFVKNRATEIKQG